MKPAPEAEPYLRELMQSLWSRRVLIVSLALLCGTAAAVLSLVLPEKYTATVSVLPISDDQSASKFGGAGMLLSQFGGLAGLSGLSLGGSQKVEALATLESAMLTRKFIEEHRLLPILYKSKWDEGRQVWTTADPKKVPTPWKAEIRFREHIRTVKEDKRTGLLAVSVTWTDPLLAAQWANAIIADANFYLRTKARQEYQKNLDYLNDQLAKTSVVEIQKAIYTLIEAEIKKVMLASGNDEYAFKVIDPAQVPEEKSSPKRVLMTIVGLFVGLVAGVFISVTFPSRAGDVVA